MHWDWEAVRAYISPLVLTIIGFLGIAKDSKDYKERAQEPGISRFRRFARARSLSVLYAATIIVAIFSFLDTHAARKEADQLKAERKTGEQQIQTLQTTVDTGNTMLGQQRQDFLKKFSEMSDRVGQLQTQVKTADLQKEAAELRSDLATTRKALEVPKVKLAFWLVSEDGTPSRTMTLPRAANGSVHIRFWIENDSDAQAVDGVVVLFACDQCRIIGNPDEFAKVLGSGENIRNMNFQNIFAHSHLPPHEADILPPAGVSSFVVGMDYRCRNCENHPYVPTGPHTMTVPPELKATIFIQQ